MFSTFAFLVRFMSGTIRIRLAVVLSAVGLLLAGCDALSAGSTPGENATSTGDNCGIASTTLVEGGNARDGIPALSNPPLVDAEHPRASYIADTNRVVGLMRDGQPLAVPHNILWHHEIVNIDDRAQGSIAVTYCPLTGSSLVFDRSTIDGAELGVSGLLLNNNLVMYDRRENESLWPQMGRQSVCGPASGTKLEMLPAIDVRWGQWRSLHPNTKVISDETGYDKNYTPSGNPYLVYQRHDDLFFDVEVDDRRPVKELVLGIPNGESGLALPFGILAERSSLRATEVTVGTRKIVVFWSRSARSAAAFERQLDEDPLSFAVEDGSFVDTQTGSQWTLDGRAVSGAHEGRSLDPVGQAHVAYWFAWATFHPNTTLWTPES